MISECDKAYSSLPEFYQGCSAFNVLHKSETFVCPVRTYRL